MRQYDITVDYRIEKGPLRGMWVRVRNGYVDFSIAAEAAATMSASSSITRSPFYERQQTWRAVSLSLDRRMRGVLLLASS